MELSYKVGSEGLSELAPNDAMQERYRMAELMKRWEQEFGDVFRRIDAVKRMYEKAVDSDIADFAYRRVFRAVR